MGAVEKRQRRQNRVLVVSYDAVFSLDIQEMLRDCGFETRHFTSYCPAAAEAMTGTDVAAAIFDLDIHEASANLPIRDIERNDIPVIVVSTDASEVRTRETCASVRFLSKPVVVEHMLPLILPVYPVYSRNSGSTPAPAGQH